MIDESWLQGGTDIPFTSAQLVIHQPRVKDILMITEERFYKACTILDINKEKFQLKQQDKNNSFDMNNFNIFMSIMTSKEAGVLKDKITVEMILTLLFPNYSVKFTNSILLIDKENKFHIINEENFDKFQEIIRSMFFLSNIGDKDGKRDYNPGGDMSRRIAEKLMNGRQKVAKMKGNGERKMSSISRYISILSVGLQKDKNDLLNYTLWQLTDEFNRYQSKVENDFYYQAKVAGATGLKDVDPWMRDLYEDVEDLYKCLLRLEEDKTYEGRCPRNM